MNSTLDGIELPPDVQAALDAAFPDKGKEKRPSEELLEAFSKACAKTRQEAINYRQASGIEEVWMRCEEQYLGVDDANRAEYASAKWCKPTSMTGPVTTSAQPAGQTNRSTVYIRLTSRYVDAGAAKLGEILLPADDKAFSFWPTPVPELIKGKDNLTQVLINNVPAERDATTEEIKAMQESKLVRPGWPPKPPLLAPAAPDQPSVEPIPPVPLRVKDLVEEAMEMATEKAKKAEDRIYDWMVESQYPMHVRKMIFDAARLGVGVLKGPYPEYSRAMSLSKGGPGPTGNGTKPKLTLQIVEELKPSVRWVDVWDFFPDPSCGENIHDGDYTWERGHISRKQLRKLKKQKGYLEDKIEQVLKEGPAKSKATDSRNPNEQLTSSTFSENRFEIWYHNGTISRDELELVNQDAAHGIPKDQKDVYAIVTMVNDTVIYATVNPLDSGSFPYRTVPWQRRVGQWAGVGIGEQVTVPQRMIVAATRSMLNNAGMSSGVQVIIDRGSVEPGDNAWALTPDKIWYMKADSKSDDVRKVFHQFKVENITKDLMQIVEYAFRLAEESTNIPLISQGQSGPTTPDTFGAAQLQNNNANQLLRDIGYHFDEYVTEPLVRDFYEYLLLDPDISDDEKGDFKINANGSIALVERAIQDQTITQILPVSTSPVYGLDPKRCMKQYLKSKRLNPTEFQYSPEEQKKIDETPPPPPPQVAVAQLKIAADAKELALDRQLEQTLAKIEMDTILQRAKLDTDRDTVYVNAETERTRAESQTRLQELLVKKELAILDYSNKRGISVEQAKATIAQTAMKLRVQKELALLTAGGSSEVTKPPTEPPARAQTGKSYQQ